MRRVLILFILVGSISGCLGPDLLPPEEQRDGILYFVEISDIDDPSTVNESAVLDYDSLSRKEQQVFWFAIRDRRYEVCDDEKVVSDALEDVVYAYEDGARYLQRDGRYYAVRTGAWQDAC